MNSIAIDINGATIENIMLDKSYDEEAYIELSKDFPTRDAAYHISAK